VTGVTPFTFSFILEEPIFEEFKGKSSTLIKQPSNEADRKSTLSFSLSLTKDSKSATPLIPKNLNHFDQGVRHNADQTDGGGYGSPYHPVGSFILLKQFSLLYQIGSLAVCKTAEGLNQLIVSQPGGSYCILGQYDQDIGFVENVVILLLYVK